MVDLVLGIAAAVGASTLYSLGIALQAMDAKQTPRVEHLRLALAWRLARRGRWLLGTGLSILGWPLQLVALLLAPIVVVKAALAAGLLVLMFLAQRMLHEHAGRNEYLAVWAIVIGVIGAGLAAPPRTTGHGSENLAITIVLVGLGLAALLPYLLRALGARTPASVTMVGAGIAGGWSGVATKLASDDLARGHVGLAAAWGLSTAVASGVAVAQRDERLAGSPGDPGGARRVRDSDGDPDRRRAAVVRRELRRHATWRCAARGIACATGDRSGAARALAPASCADGRRSRERCQRLGFQPLFAQPSHDPLQAEHRRGRSVELHDENVAGARLTLRQWALGVHAHSPSHRRGARGPPKHQLADGQPAGGCR